MILGLTEVLTAKELLQTNDLGAALSRGPNTLDRAPRVLLRVRSAAHLHQTEGYDLAIGRRHARKITGLAFNVRPSGVVTWIT
jgi:hypothetical protein